MYGGRIPTPMGVSYPAWKEVGVIRSCNAWSMGYRIDQAFCSFCFPLVSDSMHFSSFDYHIRLLRESTVALLP